MPLDNIETQRSAALKRLYLLDAEFEETYDSIAKLAADICGAPTALVSILDADRLWFKGGVGLQGVCEVPSYLSFCREAVFTNAYLEVPDATADRRFSTNPLVTEAPHFCFYAGAPLRYASQLALGTLCVLDYVPRSLNESQRRQLISLSELVMQISKKRALRINLMTGAIKRESDAVKQYRQTPAMTYSVDAEGRLLKVSNHWCKILEYSREEVIGRAITEFLTEASRRRALKGLPQFLLSGQYTDAPLQMLKKSGEVIDVLLSVSSDYDEQGRIVRSWVVIVDVTERNRLALALAAEKEKIIYQARHDELTGLINRSEFDVQLKELLVEVREHNKTHALCYLDLDQFKVVNDTCGHASGDELLRQLSVLLYRQVRKKDIFARLGGDEFGLLLRDCSLEDAQRIAQVFLSVVEDFRFSWQDKCFKIGVSIGLVPITATSENPESVLQTADTACYAAKETGRNRIYVLRERDDEFTRRYSEMQWYNRIPRALEENKFLLYAQPIQAINAKSTDKLHFEILLRLQGEDGENIPPGAFLPAAERYNLASSIDRWVVTHTLEWLAANPEIVDKLGICAINLSGQSLGNDSFYNFVLEQIKQTGIPIAKICFELTETTAVANLANAIDFMQKLRLLKCSFALDDFGSGLSSFGYLKTLPVDILKIDGLFVRDIMDDPVDLALVRSINEIAHLLGKKTVAEYVENDAIWQSLKALGVDYGQGFGICKPMPIEVLKGYYQQK